MATLNPLAFPATLRSVEDWFTHWPPKDGRNQWKEGRSAMEIARAWFSPSLAVPKELVELFSSSAHTAGLTIEKAFGEYEQELDALRGPRNVDLLLEAQTSSGGLTIHIEAKCDEAFGGGSVEDAWVKGLDSSPRSGVPSRVRNLSSLLFGTSEDSAIEDLPLAIRQLKYQLLYGVAAPLLQARWSHSMPSTAVFIVHELLPLDHNTSFRGSDGNDRTVSSVKVQQNASDLNDLIKLITKGNTNAISPGEFVDCGMFYPPADTTWKPAKGEVPVRLLIGKIVSLTSPVA